MDVVKDKEVKSRPWVEKWRPQKVEDVSHQEEVVKTLKTSIEKGSVSHLLFHGPPGTGKTTTGIILRRSKRGSPQVYSRRAGTPSHTSARRVTRSARKNVRARRGR